MTGRPHLIFDVGGTLIFDPFEGAIACLAQPPYRERLLQGLREHDVNGFMDRWRNENSNTNFQFASHFLQEEIWIARAALPGFDTSSVRSNKDFPTWLSETLALYRSIALKLISQQPHLPDVRRALTAAKARGYRLSVASNDRHFATAAMLAAANLDEFFDHMATSEMLSGAISGAEKPSPLFFEAFQLATGLRFSRTNTFYIGDDETRDIQSTSGLPMRNCRFLGNRSQSTGWLDNSQTTRADSSFEHYSEFLMLIESGWFEESSGSS